MGFRGTIDACETFVVDYSMEETKAVGVGDRLKQPLAPFLFQHR